MKEYKAEGLTIEKIDFKDNSDVIDVFEKAPSIFSIVDDACRLKNKEAKT